MSKTFLAALLIIQTSAVIFLILFLKKKISNSNVKFSMMREKYLNLHSEHTDLIVQYSRVPCHPFLDEILTQADNIDENHVRDLILYSPEDKEYLLTKLNDIFPDGYADFQPQDIFISLCRFMASNHEAGGIPTNTSSRCILEGQKASCGGFAWLMCDFARVMGYPARYLGVFGNKKAGSHALSEIFYDHAWHLFDPTFGVFFFSHSSIDKLGHVLSSKEIATFPKRPTMFQTVREPWLKNYAEEQKYGLHKVSPNAISYWVEYNRQHQFPIARGRQSTVSFPVIISLSTESSKRILGSQNNKWRDVYDENFWDPSTGYFYVGGSCPTSILTVSLSVDEPCWVTITFSQTDETTGDLSIFPLESFHLASLVKEGKLTKIRGLINSTRNQGQFIVWCKQYYCIDHMEFEKGDIAFHERCDEITH